MATSTPRGFNSFTFCIASSTFLELIKCVAPRERAVCNRLSSKSIMIILEGEKNCAVNSVAKPTGPAPTIATVLPGLTFPFNTPIS